MEFINKLASSVIEIDGTISLRAKEFEKAGLQAFDAMHLACSENRADVLLTADDKFLKRALKIEDLKIKVSNPLKWLDALCVRVVVASIEQKSLQIGRAREVT